MKVESFYCEHTGKLIGGQSASATALQYAIKTLHDNFKEGFMYKCNYDAFVEIKPGCWRRILRFIMRKKKEESIIIKYKYAIFDKVSMPEHGQFEFIEIKPVSAEHELGALANKNLLNPYLETGKIAIQDYLEKNPKIKPYCDLEVMVKVNPGCFKKVWNKISGNSHKNKFSFRYFEFNIAQKFV